MRSLGSAAVLVAVVACSSIEVPPPGTPVTITRLHSGSGSWTYNSALRQPERLVLRDNAAWLTAWGSLWPNGAPIPAPLPVDFSHEMIIMAALGEQRTGGYTITLDSARMTNVGLYVFVGTQSPGAHCGTTQALTQPVDIARLQRIDGAVHFVDVAMVRDCP